MSRRPQNKLYLNKDERKMMELAKKLDEFLNNCRWELAKRILARKKKSPSGKRCSTTRGTRFQILRNVTSIVSKGRVRQYGLLYSVRRRRAAGGRAKDTSTKSDSKKMKDVKSSGTSRRVSQRSRICSSSCPVCGGQFAPLGNLPPTSPNIFSKRQVLRKKSRLDGEKEMAKATRARVYSPKKKSEKEGSSNERDVEPSAKKRYKKLLNKSAEDNSEPK